MDIFNIFEDMLTYPFRDLNKFLTIGILSLLVFPSSLLILRILAPYSIEFFLENYFELKFVVYAISLMVSVFISGYCFSIVKNTLKNKESLPEFDLINNTVNGIKVFFINFIYYLIPFLITIIAILVVNNQINYLSGLKSFLLSCSSITIFNIFSTDPTLYSTMILFFVNFTMPFIIFIITIFQIIAIGRFVDNNSFKSAFQFKKIVKSIKNIGIRKYSMFFIILQLIYFIFELIIRSIELVSSPIAIVVISLLILPFIALTSSRAIGLIYKESK